ncbi:hypothetical protein AGMMS49938_13400 [Fibrobacterales bacterium]|nr:hypothetical protein AGMMS49938_13400 [Fibrobacterales bacterium]
MSETYSLEDKGNYYLLTRLNLEAENFHDVLRGISEKLSAKKQDVVLSLASVKALYSSHLAVFVRLHQQIQKIGYRFIITDISPEVKNLLQITQLDSIFMIYNTLDEFLGKGEKNIGAEKNNFEWSVQKMSYDQVKVPCSGSMNLNDSFNELYKSVDDYYYIEFDFSKVRAIDSGSANLLGKIAEKHTVSVKGASEDIIERFRQERIYGKIRLV